MIAFALTACGATDPSSDPLDEVVQRLRGAGASVQVTGTVEQPFFPVEGRTLRVDGQDVQAFVFSDEAAARAQARGISADGSQVGTSLVLWVAPPHFYRAGRVILLYVGSDAHTLDVLSRALGPPFAGS